MLDFLWDFPLTVLVSAVVLLITFSLYRSAAWTPQTQKQMHKQKNVQHTKSSKPLRMAESAASSETIQLSQEERIRLSDEKKAQANKALLENHFQEAIDLYSEAIELNPSNAILWSNRAQAHIKIEEYGSALEDATKSIELDPNYLKGYFRRGSANMALFKYKDALKDFRSVAKKAPKDESNIKKMKECEKIIQRAAFEDAISADRHAHPIHVDTSKIEIEDGYKGPHLSKDGINLEFVKDLMEFQRNEKNLHQKYVVEILESVKKVLSEQPTLVDIEIPENGRFTVCGDVHGQYYDLLNIFKLNGLPSPDNPYLFNGDFVDRGSFSVEVILLLLSFKLLYPKHFHLARGNHESRNLNKMYGFEGEVKYKYNEGIFELFLEVFCWLPLAHVLNKKVFVVHGGLCRKDGVKLDDIRKVDRNCEPPDEGIMCDLLWSDPQSMPGRTPSKRGVGVNFGPDVTRAFLDDNGLQMIVRSHEVKQNGYQIEVGGRLVTVFSAPNYCDQMGNKGAFIVFDHEGTPTYQTFDAVPHPKVPAMKYAQMYNLFGM